jgi:hypothetical protein
MIVHDQAGRQLGIGPRTRLLPLLARLGLTLAGLGWLPRLSRLDALLSRLRFTRLGRLLGCQGGDGQQDDAQCAR